jgi:hypothetical protein
LRLEHQLGSFESFDEEMENGPLQPSQEWTANTLESIDSAMFGVSRLQRE